jgi:hypothetical protein
MKKITHRALLMVIMAFLFANISYATATASTEGFEVIPTKYPQAGNFSEGLAPVLDENTGKWGYVDKTGEMVIAPKYSRADDFSEGLARIAICDNWDTMGVYGIIDKTGEIIVPAKYDNIYHFSGDLFANYTGGKWGIIDKTGEVVVEPKYDNMNSLKNGLSKISNMGKWGYIDNTGKEIIPPKYTGLGDFFGGLALVGISGKWGYINQMGEEVIPMNYYNPLPDFSHDNFSEGLAAVGVGTGLDSKHGFVDITGKEVVAPKYTEVHSFSEGLAAVRIGDGADRKWGFIDKTGKEVISPKYKSVGDFCEGLAPVELGNKKWALIDKTGQELVTLNYDSVRNFSDGYALVYLHGKYGLIDKKGKEIAPPKYDNIGKFSEGLAIVRIGFTYGYIDKTGKEVISLKYSNAKDFSHGVAIIESGYQKCGLIDNTGKEIVLPKYTSIGDNYGRIDLSEGMVRVRDKNGYGFINIVGDASTATPVVKDTTQLDNATAKVKQAVNNRTFYNYMMAYIDILNLPVDQQGNLLNQLNPVFNDANTPKVQKAMTMLETVAKDKDGKIYADTEAYLTGISSNEMDEFTKGYLLGELTSWGRQFVFTSDYVKAVDSLNVACINKDSKSISEAETLIGQVVNSASKSYLLGKLNNLK